MKKISLTILGLLVGLAVISYFYSYPSYEGYQNYRNDLVNQTKELDNLKKKQDLIKALEAAEPTLSQKTGAALNLIPTTDERERFVSQFDALAQSTGTTLSTFSFSAEKSSAKKTNPDDEESGTKKVATKSTTSKTATKTSKLGTVSYSVTITGPYSSVRDFLYKAQTIERYTSLTNLALAGADGNQVSLVLNGAIYTKPEPKIPSNLKLRADSWNYLDNRLTSQTPAQPTTGRADPFASY